MVESTLMVHMNATLADATRTAWKVFLLTSLLSADISQHLLLVTNIRHVGNTSRRTLASFP